MNLIHTLRTMLEQRRVTRDLMSERLSRIDQDIDNNPWTGAAMLFEPAPEHPTVTAMRDALAKADADEYTPDPAAPVIDSWDDLEALFRAQDERAAYATGRHLADHDPDPYDIVTGDQTALTAALGYLTDPRHGTHGARLAALVLAGYTGQPAEAVR